MRVLHVHYVLNAGGGIESFLMNFFRACRTRDISMEVCCVSGQPGTLAPECEALGLKVWCCRQPAFYPTFIRTFERELRARGPYDVVHSHFSNFGGPAMKVAHRLGVPIRLAHYHNAAAGHRNDWPRRQYERWMRRMVLASATGIVGCAWAAIRYSYPDLWQRDPRMFVVRYGLNLQTFDAVSPTSRRDVRAEFNIAPEAPLIGHVGRFVWQKNHEGLIRAARLLVDRDSATRLILIGDGELRPRITELVQELRLSDHVIFTGLRSDVPRLLAAMDVFTLPSLSEGFGLACVEAQVMGLPVVAADLPAAREAVAPAFHQYFCDPRDATALADAIADVLERRAADATLRQQAVSFGRQFSVAATCEAMRAAWRYPGAVAPPDPAYWAGPRGGSTPAAAPATTSRN